VNPAEKHNPKAFDRVQIEELATGDFIRRRNNLIMVGWRKVTLLRLCDRRSVSRATAFCIARPPSCSPT
jgi:hypothetical protein